MALCPTSLGIFAIPSLKSIKKRSTGPVLYSFGTPVTLGLLSLSLPSVEELGRGEVAEGLMRTDGVIGALPGQEL